MVILLMLLQKINAFIFLMQEKIQVKMKIKMFQNILTLVYLVMLMMKIIATKVAKSLLMLIIVMS